MTYLVVHHIQDFSLLTRELKQKDCTSSNLGVSINLKFKMRRLSFIITIIGLFTLVLLLNLQAPIKLNSKEQLQKLNENQKVKISGKVISERQITGAKILTLQNSFILLCKNCPPYLKKNITAIGIIQPYQKEKEINILKIRINDYQ